MIVKSILSTLEKIANIKRIRGHSIWMVPLSQKSLIVDLGGHKGEFSKYFSNLLKCQIYCIEANPELAATIEISGQVDNLAITSDSTLVNFSIASNPEGSSLLSNLSDEWGTVKTVQVQGLPLSHYFEKHKISRVSLLKSDVEGAELNIFNSLDIATLRSIDQLTVEFHDFLDSSQLPLVKSTIRKLERSGFLFINCNFPYHDDTLFIKKEILMHPKYWLAHLKLLFIKVVYIFRGITHQVLKTIKTKFFLK